MNLNLCSTSRKKFKYISVATRLQRYFANTCTSKMLRMHSQCVSDCCEVVTNIHQSKALFLTGIIPGPKEPKNMDPYIDVLVDDTLDLDKMVVYDEFQKEHFTLKGNILLHVLDYPEQTKLFKRQG